MDFIEEEAPSIVIVCCRICLATGIEFLDVFADGDIEEGISIAHILRECTSYSVALADNISNKICHLCLENAIFAFRLRRQADSSYRYLTGVMEMPQRSAIMLVEIGTQTDESIFKQQLKQKHEQLKLDDDQQTFYSIINNNNDNNLNNNNSNFTSIIPSHNQLTYENQTVSFETMLLYDDDIGEGDIVEGDIFEGDGDDDDNLIPPISSSSLTSTVTDDPPTATTTTTTTIELLTTSPKRARTRRQYRNTKHCATTTNCKLCGVKNNCLLELRDHLMIEHMFVELTLGLQCRLCDNEYSRKDHLVRHLRNIHKVSRDRDDGRIKIEEPRTLTMGQCVNDNEKEQTDDTETTGTTTTSSSKQESTYDLKTKTKKLPSSPSLSSLSSVSLSPRRKFAMVDDGVLHEPEFVRSGEELHNFKVKLLRTNFSQYDDPLKDASNMVNVEYNRHEIEIDNIISDSIDGDDQDDDADGVDQDDVVDVVDGDDYDDDGGGAAAAANIEPDDVIDDGDVNMECDDNVNMEDDDVNGPSDIKTCFSFVENNKSLAKYYEITTSYDQETSNDNNIDEDGGDGDGDGDNIDYDDNIDDDDVVVDNFIDYDDDEDVDNTNVLFTLTPSLDFSKNHQCDICDRKFHRKFQLVRHMLAHTKTKDFKCEQCQMTFGRSDQKAQHHKECYKPLRRNLNLNKPLMN